MTDQDCEQLSFYWGHIEGTTEGLLIGVETTPRQLPHPKGLAGSSMGGGSFLCSTAAQSWLCHCTASVVSGWTSWA